MLTLIKTTSGFTATPIPIHSRKSNKTDTGIHAASADDQVITILENLLVQARNGELTGLMYVVRLRGQDHGVGVAGHYLNDVRAGLSAFALVYGLLGDSLSAHQQP